MNKNYKIVVFVPSSHSDIVRDAMGKVGAGKIGNYAYCSFTTKGIGRFLPEDGAHPTIGAVGKFEEVEEEKIEMVCEGSLLPAVIAAIKQAHPYEEVALDVYPLEMI